MKFKNLKKLIHEAKKINMKQGHFTDVVYLFELALDMNSKEGMLARIMETFVHLCKFTDYVYQNPSLYATADSPIRIPLSLVDTEYKLFMYHAAVRENDLSGLLALAYLLEYKDTFFDDMLKYIKDLQEFHGVFNE